MDTGEWWATVHGVAESWTWLSNEHTWPCVSVETFFFFNHYLETVLFQKSFSSSLWSFHLNTCLQERSSSEQTWGIATEEHSCKECGKPFNTGICSTEQKVKRLSAITMRKPWMPNSHEDLSWRERPTECHRIGKPPISPHSINCENSLQRNLWA